jgi:hypothetical protein
VGCPGVVEVTSKDDVAVLLTVFELEVVDVLLGPEDWILYGLVVGVEVLSELRVQCRRVVSNVRVGVEGPIGGDDG